MNNYNLLEPVLFSVIIASCLAMIFFTLEKWNFSEWFKVRTGINICYFCLSFWIGAVVTCIYCACFSEHNLLILASILMIPSLTQFIHNSPLKGQ